MLAVCSTSSLCLKAPALPRRARATAARSVVPVRAVCQQQTVFKKAAAAAAVALPSLTSLPALALVDERLAGEGTGRIFGISNGAEGWAIFLVFGLIWAIFYTSQRDLGAFEDEDSGMQIK